MLSSTIADISMTPFDTNSAFGSRLMAYASEQLQQAQNHLAREGEARHSGIHEARKCIRRTRATLALGIRVFDQRGKRLADDLGRLCRGLSSLRDAQALIEALQRLGSSAPSAVRAILPRAEMAARKRRDQMLERALKRDPEFSSRRRRLLAAQERLLRLEWQAVSEEDVSKAVTRSKRRADKARQQSKQHPDDDKAWHVFRRRLRRLRQQDSLLAELQPNLRGVTKGTEHQARALGESQDDVLLLGQCGRRSPFPPDQRKLLRNIARERLQKTRFT
jgi:CHAD domain